LTNPAGARDGLGSADRPQLAAAVASPWGVAGVGGVDTELSAPAGRCATVRNGPVTRSAEIDVWSGGRAGWWPGGAEMALTCRRPWTRPQAAGRGGRAGGQGCWRGRSGRCMLGLAAVFWLDQRLRQAGRSELIYLGAENLPAAVAAISAATVGTVLSGRRPAHPVGWLLLGLGLVVPAAGVVIGYTRYGVMAPVAAGRQLAGRGLQQHHRSLGGLWRLHRAARPHREVAIAALALVGVAHHGRDGTVPAGDDLGPHATVPGGPGFRQPAGRPGPGADRPGRRRAGAAARTGGRSRLAGGALPPRRWHRASAVALAGVRWRLGGGCRGRRRRHPGRPAGRRPRGHRRCWHMCGATATGHRRGDPALPVVSPGPHHQPHLELRAADGAARWRLRRGGPRARPARGQAVEPGGGRGDPGDGCGVPASPPPCPAGSRPAFQPPPLRHHPNDPGIRRPAAPAGRPRQPRRRASEPRRSGGAAPSQGAGSGSCTRSGSVPSWWLGCCKRRSTGEGGECLVERSAGGGFVPCQIGAECSGEPGDCLACGLVADAVGQPGAGDAGGCHVGGGAGGQAFLDLGEGGPGA
jgi:hypothetical protein